MKESPTARSDRSHEEFARTVVELCVDAGASAAEVGIREGSEFSTCVRLGKVEKLLQARFRKVGIRVLSGSRAAVSSTSDFNLETVRSVIADTLAMARAASEDSANGIPAADEADSVETPALFFPRAGTLSADDKIDLARRCEEASLRYDPRITNSEGGSYSECLESITYANSSGRNCSYARSRSTLSSVPLAEGEGQKQRDYWFSTHLDLDRLAPPEEVGAEAARRTLRRLGSRKKATCSVPVVFDPLCSASLLRHLADAVSGTFLLRRASFLLDRIGETVASPLVTVLDDALLPGGLASRPFDAEGLPSRRTAVIQEGKLQSYLLDGYSARKLGLKSTSNSNRDLSGPPTSGPTNFFLEAGNLSPQEIISSVRNGLYVTELIGFGVDIVSGNYSQGAAGLWIEGGELAYPVEEITVAGNLTEMLTSIEAVGNDLLMMGEIFAPTLKISRMVVSGEQAER